MERFTVTMNSEDIDLFERRRAELGFSKSAFIRYLIAAHENNIPDFIQHKELIKQMAELNTHMREIVINNQIDTTQKIIISEKIEALNTDVKTLIKNCAKLAQTDREKNE